jgi:hypothetical protein
LEDGWGKAVPPTILHHWRPAGNRRLNGLAILTASNYWGPARPDARGKLVFRCRCRCGYAIGPSDETDFSNHRETVMRLLLKLAVVLVICLVIIGFWQHWFSISRTSTADADGKTDFNVSVDKTKMKADVKKAKEMVKEEIGKLKGKAKADEAK